MQFFIAPALFAALVAAKASFTNPDFSVQDGKPFKLTWTGAQGPVSILLKNGPSGNLKTVSTLTCKSPRAVDSFLSRHMKLTQPSRCYWDRVHLDS